MRKLASIQRIWDITPIEGADKIETAHVFGWTCVTGKGDFQKGDLCVYFEIDSFLPCNVHFEFLRSKSYKKSNILGEGMYLKTMKFRGQYSQGLVMPLSAFPEIETEGKAVDELLGMDVTELLGVRKWEIEERVTGSGTIIGERPAYIPKTDETRVQSEPTLIQELKGKPYYMTTKMDGSSHSIGLIADENNPHEYIFNVCGHNYEYADDGKSSFYEFVKKNGYEKQMRDYIAQHPGMNIKTFVIQGEWCGPGIQSNPIGLTKAHWFVFTLSINGKRLGMSDNAEEDMFSVAHALSMETVPVVKEGETFSYSTSDELLEKADGIYEKYDGNGVADHPREGLVIRPKTPEKSYTSSTWLSMKAVSNRYLAKKAKKE